MQKKPELLVPLNDWRTLNKQGSVIENGDAFYFGLKSNFSMRARAGNFSVADLPSLVKLIHSNGKHLYLCTNIIIYDDEINELEKDIKSAHEVGVDAIICHDMAAISICKSLKIPFHVSTQANISNMYAAKFYSELGAERIILARELNLSQIKSITKNINIPVEAFIHGAMCTAISGRCYLSAELMNFNQEYSANRGKCIQPCRRYYTFKGEEEELINYDPVSGMFFNAKDLCMIEHLDKLIDSGIQSFKIEGRMRDPLYISEVASCYREAIDAYYMDEYTDKNIEIWGKRLSKVFNRGFHTGFYFSQPSVDGVERNVRGNISNTRKHLVGKVKNYYKKAEAAEIELTNGRVKIGDEIIIQNATDFFYRMKIASLRIENENVYDSGLASSNNHILIGVKTDHIIPINADVYLYLQKE